MMYVKFDVHHFWRINQNQGKFCRRNRTCQSLATSLGCGPYYRIDRTLHTLWEWLLRNSPDCLRWRRAGVEIETIMLGRKPKQEAPSKPLRPVGIRIGILRVQIRGKAMQ